MDDGRVGQAGSGFCRVAVIDGVVDLVADEVDSARRGEVVQVVQLRIGDRGTGGIVGTVNQNQLGIPIREVLDFVEIDAEVVLLANRVEASLEPKRLGQGGEGRIAGLRQDDVGSGFRGQPEQNKKSFRGAGDDLDSVGIHALHVGDGGAQAVGSGGLAVGQGVMQEALPVVVSGEAEDLVEGPARAFARCQVEFDVVLVGGQPDVEEEGFQLHVGPRRVRSGDG